MLQVTHIKHKHCINMDIVSSHGKSNHHMVFKLDSCLHVSRIALETWQPIIQLYLTNSVIVSL